jgi:ABC-type nitrate/sulfonate/bicarbonate transport system substrate-binding protein
MKNNKLILIIVGIVVVVAAALLWPRKPAENPASQPLELRLAADEKAVVSLLAIVAEKKQLWAQENLKVTFQRFASGRDAAQSLLAKNSDAATMAEFPFMLASHQHADLRLLATIAESEKHMQVIGDRKAGVASVADLKGKKVGATVGSAGQYLLATVAQGGGLDIGKDDIAHFAPPELEAAMARRGLAAVSTWQPHVARIQAGLGEDAVVLSGGGYKMSFNVVAFGSTVNEKREAFLRLLRAFKRAEEFVKANQAEAVGLLAETTGIEREVVEKILRDYQFEVGLNEHVIATLEKQDEWAVASKLAEAKLPPGEWRKRVETSLLKEVAPAAVRLNSPQ